MRIQIMSDLHLEFAPFRLNPVDAEVLLLAGDIHNGMSGINWILKTITYRPVIYVLGNHEFYGQRIPKLVAEIKEVAEGTNVHVLENEGVEIGNIVFLGATLWTDFRLNGDAVLAQVTAQTNMNDFRRIRMTPSYRRFRPSDARQLHAESARWLARETARHRGRRVVIVTHHAPSSKSIPAMFAGNPLNPAFASDLEGLIRDCGAALWVHGHIHTRSDYEIGPTRVIANPRGYPSEGQTGFDPCLIVEV